MTTKGLDLVGVKLELAALNRELKLENDEHKQTVARINKDIKQAEKALRSLEKKDK